MIEQPAEPIRERSAARDPIGERVAARGAPLEPVLKPREATTALRAPGISAAPLAPIGRTLLAIALLGLGIEHFLFGDFMTGRAPAWPDGVPGRTAWAGVSGAVFVATATAILARRKARYAAFAAALLLFVWALLRHVPVLAADSFLAPSWTTAGKALMLIGGVLGAVGRLPREPGAGDRGVLGVVNRESGLVLLAAACLGIFFVITGIQHFLFTEFVASLVPGWIPGSAVAWTHVTGIALIAAGVGLHVPRTARAAALLSGLMVLSWFFVVHLPRTFLNTSSALAVFEALAVSGIAFVIAGDDGHSGSRHRGRSRRSAASAR